ncbi:MAG TPA: hypothetical protein VF663_12660 [Telluria sp.]|jgi:hypothetical protein
MLNERKDQLSAQKVEVALVFQQMLGTAEAEAYLALNGFPAEMIARILARPDLRRCYTDSTLAALLEQDA